MTVPNKTESVSRCSTNKINQRLSVRTSMYVAVRIGECHEIQAGVITGCRSNIKQSMRCTEQSFERMSCNEVHKQEKSKLKELLQLKFLTLIFYERRELETRRLFSIDRKKFLGLVRTEIILTSISPVPAADQNVWNCSRKSIG